MAKFYLYAIAIAISFTGGWKAAQWQRDSQQLDTVIEQQESTAQTIKTAAHIDTKHTETREALQRENNDIVRDIDAGRIRLYIPAATVSTCTSAASMGNGTGAADTNAGSATAIESDTAAEIIMLTARGDDAIAKLTALQEYVRSVCLRPALHP